MKYQVSLIKKETYVIEAEDEDEAKIIALDLYSADKTAFTTEQIEEIKVEGWYKTNVDF